MPAIVRVGDPHACGAVAIEGSPNTFVNGKPVHCVGDADSHGTVQAQGSPNVFVNGRAVARVGDNHSGCPEPDPPHPPSPHSAGSPNVFVNGG